MVSIGYSASSGLCFNCGLEILDCRWRLILALQQANPHVS
jgi:hypothetical protein